MLLTVWLSLAVAAAEPVREWPAPEEPMELTAQRLRYVPSTGVLTADGDVVIRTQRLTLHADHVTYEQESGEVAAEGNVSLTSGTTAALASRVKVNVRTLVTRVEDASFLQKRDITPAALAATTPEMLRTAGKNTLALRGQRIRRTSPNALDVEGLTFTPCDCDPLHPSWRVQATKAHIVTGEHAFLLWPVIYVGPVPVLAFPILDLPLSDRRSGLLVPRPGVDPKRGFSLEQPIFLTLGRSYDVTITPGYYFGSTIWKDDARFRKDIRLPSVARSVQGPRLLGELRYAPTHEVSGTLRLGLLYDLFPKRDPVRPDCLYDPLGVGCISGTGVRGLRGEALWQHQTDFGKGFYARADAALVSDGYYLGDLSTDLFVQGTPYTRSTATVFHRSAETYTGLDVTYRQDLRYGFNLIGRAEGPNTLQRLPALTFALPDRPLWGNLMAGIRAEAVRIAPVRYGTGDEGTDGVFACTPGQGVGGCEAEGQGNHRFEPGEREARLRLDLRPRLSYPFSIGRFLRVTPSVWYRESLYLGELTGTFRQRGYGLGSLEIQTQLDRAFGSGPSALHHSITPAVELRYVPRVFGSTLGSYDEVDQAIPQPLPGQTGLAQAVVEVRQRLYQGGHEWLRLDVGQGFDLLGGGRLADTYGRLAIAAGPFRGSTLARFDPVRKLLAQLSAQARWSEKNGEIYAQYDTFAVQGSDRLRRSIDALVGPAGTLNGTEAQQIIAGVRYMLRFGLGLSYEAVVVPQASLAIMRLAQQRIGITLAPACGCWSLEGGVRLLPSSATRQIQVNFEANLTIAHFGSIGTGG